MKSPGGAFTAIFGRTAGAGGFDGFPGGKRNEVLYTGWDPLRTHLSPSTSESVSPGLNPPRNELLIFEMTSSSSGIFQSFWDHSVIAESARAAIWRIVNPRSELSSSYTRSPNP